MVCLICAAWDAAPVCGRCRRGLRPGPVRTLDEVEVASAFLHSGPARVLVHRLKYEGLVDAARALGSAMVPLLPTGTAALVPVPRVVWRRIRYGVDPADELARAIASVTGLPVCRPLRPALVGPRHAGRSRSARQRPMFGVESPPPPESVLIDDVVTTGTTLAAARAALGGHPRHAVTGTAAPAMTSLPSGRAAG